MIDPHPIQSEAVAHAITELEAILDLCAKQGVPLAVVSIPYASQVYAEMLQGHGYDLNFPQHHIELFCARHAIPYFDMLPSFRQAASTSSGSFYLQNDPHFNDDGHELAGKLLALFVGNLLSIVPETK